jgi:hypothetical protein
VACRSLADEAVWDLLCCDVGFVGALDVADDEWLGRCAVVLSACATGDPAASAAPTPNVIAPAPNQVLARWSPATPNLLPNVKRFEGIPGERNYVTASAITLVCRYSSELANPVLRPNLDCLHLLNGRTAIMLCGQPVFA